MHDEFKFDYELLPLKIRNYSACARESICKYVMPFEDEGNQLVRPSTINTEYSYGLIFTADKDKGHTYIIILVDQSGSKARENKSLLCLLLNL